jgi:hypothetical protein
MPSREGPFPERFDAVRLTQRQHAGILAHPIRKEASMTARPRPTHSQPGGFEDPEKAEDEMINDSLGTVNIADSTGTDEDKETGDAKDNNMDTKED